MQSSGVKVRRTNPGTSLTDTAILTISGELGITAMVGPDAKHSGIDGDTQFYLSLKEALPTIPKRVVVDISGVSYLSSLGMGALLRFQGEIRAAGGEMRLAAPSELIGALLHRCRLDHAFKIFPDVASAIKA